MAQPTTTTKRAHSPSPPPPFTAAESWASVAKRACLDESTTEPALTGTSSAPSPVVSSTACTHRRRRRRRRRGRRSRRGNRVSPEKMPSSSSTTTTTATTPRSRRQRRPRRSPRSARRQPKRHAAVAVSSCAVQTDVAVEQATPMMQTPPSTMPPLNASQAGCPPVYIVLQLPPCSCANSFPWTTPPYSQSQMACPQGYCHPPQYAPFGSFAPQVPPQCQR